MSEPFHKYTADEEELLMRAVAWEHELDAEEDREEILRRRKRLRHSDAYDLLWRYENSPWNS